MGLAWLVAVTSVAMMFLWSAMLRRLEPVEVAVCSNLQPLATAGLVAVAHASGARTAKPDLGLAYWLGTALVIGGVALTQRRSRKEA
jgi:drug/metabolite transporter (DMT)-like permease